MGSATGIYKEEQSLLCNMGDGAVSPFVSLLTTKTDCARLIYSDHQDDRTLRMLRCLVQTSKKLRDEDTLKTVVADLKKLHAMRTCARDVLEEHLRATLLDNSVLARAWGPEMSGFHLLHAVRTLCEGIRCSEGLQADFKKIETGLCVEMMLGGEDCVLLVGDMRKYVFSPKNAMYLFECVAYGQSNAKYEEFQYTHTSNRHGLQWALNKLARKRHAGICFRMAGAGVYAAMFSVCVRNGRDRRLVSKFMDIAFSVPSHPGKNALVSVFETPGNLVQLQTLIHRVCHEPCSWLEFEHTYSNYCWLTKLIFECVEDGKLSFSDADQFHASTWMIRNLEAMMHIRDDDDLKYRLQNAICTHMNMDTIAKLYQEGYIQRLAETGAEQLDIFHDLARRWNAVPSNLNPWTLDGFSLPYPRFLGLSPDTL